MSKNKIIETEQIEHRAAGELRMVEIEGAPPHVAGYAALFNVLSDNLGGFFERIDPGTFTKTLLDSDVRALWNHDSNFVLGRKSNNTLTLWEDDAGLGFEFTPPDTQWANDLLVNIRRGDVNQMSFGFRTVEDDWLKNEDGTIIRTLKEVKLYDVSPVTFPAYPQTSAQVRSKIVELTTAEIIQVENHADGGHNWQVPVLRHQLKIVRLSLGRRK